MTGIQYSNATFTIQAGSGGIDDTEEKCNFLFKSLPDEGEIVARVKTFQGTHVSDKAGIMIRESLDDDFAVGVLDGDARIQNFTCNTRRPAPARAWWRWC